MINCLTNQDEIDDQEDIISKTIITQKQFAIDELNYNYMNKYKLEKVSENVEASSLKIKNLPCVMNGNQLKKVTEIQYGGKKYYIQDVYILSTSSSSENSSKSNSVRNQVSLLSSSHNVDNSSKDSQNKSLKKFCLFRKGKGKQQLQKRNTKNVPKNFCKAFLNHLQTQKKSHSDNQKIQHCIHQLQSFIGHKKYYNNTIIWKIISSNACKQYFRHFLQENAKSWIEKSRIEDKKVHLQAIEIYLKIYDKKTFLEDDEDNEDDQQEQSSSK